MQIIAEELKTEYKNTVPVKERVKITCPNDINNYLREKVVFDPNTIDLYEQFYIILLNTANHVIGHHMIAQGGVSGLLVDAKLVFGCALRNFASAIILCHNHPSGVLRPSQADFNLTHYIVKGAGYLDLEILDHIILSSEGFYSFADDGFSFKTSKINDDYGDF